MERDAVVRNGMARDLINVRALARYIQTSVSDDVTFEALVAAIRRYPARETAAKRRDVGEMITKLSMKNNVVQVPIKNRPEIPTILAKFSEKVDYARGETLGIATGIQTDTVVIDSNNLDRLTGLLPKNSVLKIIRNLSAVMLSMQERELETPGVLATLSAEIAMEGINHYDILHSTPDSMFVVDDKDALRTYRALERLVEGG